MSEKIYYNLLRRVIYIDPLLQPTDEESEIKQTFSDIAEILKDVGKISHIGPETTYILDDINQTTQQFYVNLTLNPLFPKEEEAHELNLPDCRILNYFTAYNTIQTKSNYNRQYKMKILSKVYYIIDHQIHLFLTQNKRHIVKELKDFLPVKKSSGINFKFSSKNNKFEIANKEKYEPMYKNKKRKFTINQKIDFTDFSNMTNLKEYLKNIEIKTTQ